MNFMTKGDKNTLPKAQTKGYYPAVSPSLQGVKNTLLINFGFLRLHSLAWASSHSEGTRRDEGWHTVPQFPLL